jgi:hypothetical protein
VSAHRWIPHAFTQAQARPIKESAEGLKADPVGQAAGGLLILAFAVGALGAGAAASGYDTADHASGHQAESVFHLAASVDHVAGDLMTPMPWMY